MNKYTFKSVYSDDKTISESDKKSAIELTKKFESCFTKSIFDELNEVVTFATLAIYEKGKYVKCISAFLTKAKAKGNSSVWFHIHEMNGLMFCTLMNNDSINNFDVAYRKAMKLELGEVNTIYTYSIEVGKTLTNTRNFYTLWCAGIRLGVHEDSYFSSEVYGL